MLMFGYVNGDGTWCLYEDTCYKIHWTIYMKSIEIWRLHWNIHYGSGWLNVRVSFGEKLSTSCLNPDHSCCHKIYE